MTIPVKRSLRNLALLVFGALPLALLVGWIIASVAPVPWLEVEQNASAGEFVESFLLWFLFLVVPVLLGGAIHQVLLGLIPPGWAPTRRRVAIMVTSPVVMVMLALLNTGSPALLFSWRVLVPIGVALLFYGSLAKPLEGEAAV